MEIRDPIHGNIAVGPIEQRIIDTPEMQRLKYIKQLDLSYLVFPGANNTRFEHSLGTMQVSKDLFLEPLGRDEREFSYIGLLHDIGHGPFSHLSEPYVERALGKNHEQLGEERIRNSEISDIISDSGMSLNKVLAYFRGSEKINVVGGALGADRIDYLMRDSHYTGVAYGVIDYERLKTRLVLYKGKVAVLESGISGAESMLIARYFMHSNVYKHHAKVIAAGMLREAIDISMASASFTAREMWDMSDEGLMMTIMRSKSKDARELVGRISERKLYKRAYDSIVPSSVRLDEVRGAVRKTGLKGKDFVAEIISLGGEKDDITVVNRDGDKIGNLTELSPFIKTLMDVLSKRRLIVACDKKNIDKVRLAVDRVV
ncbi:MAG: HD domain-containing protein [Candidatus Micrarchaeota archaeon]|nr:HD domain-containing protein [Candidatus Micrarchaeota archaeon]